MPEFIAHIRDDGTTQSVKDHLEGVAELAAGYARPFGGEKDAWQAGMLHDLGKYSEGFQQHITHPEVVMHIDHSTAGAQVVNSVLPPKIASRAALPVSFVIAGHHSGLPDGGSDTDAPSRSTMMGRLKRKLQPNEAFDDWKLDQQEIPLGQPPAFCRTTDSFTVPFYTRMLYSCLVDADFLDTERFMNGVLPRSGFCDLEFMWDKLQQYVSGWWDSPKEINQHRCEILRACMSEAKQPKGLFTMTVPTGGGKTVSSFAFALHHALANHMERIIYVIPFNSIIDQTAEVFGKIVGPENVLEHHSGMDYAPDDSADESMRRKALATENWQAPLVVTTAVQFFESLFANKSSRCRKLHNIANSVIIFDEAQTLPVPYLQPCIAAIAQLVKNYGASAVLCTATQPALNDFFAEYGLQSKELCPRPEQQYDFFRRNTLCNLGEITEEELCARLNSEQQVLCIVNRKLQAQKCYDALQGEKGNYCLTTLLYPQHRKRLLAEIRKRLCDGMPCRVNATSLVEAGVDLDFPVVYRQEAGLDSILQAAGRCNREMTRSPLESKVFVYRLPERSLQMLKQNISATQSVMKKYEDPSSPEAIEQYFRYFRALRGTDALDQKQILSAFRDGIEGCRWPFAKVAERFSLIDSPTQTVYVPLEEGKELVERLRRGEHSRKLYRELGRYGVSVYPQHFQHLYDAGAIEVLTTGESILCDTTLYHSLTGLMLRPEEGRALGLDDLF